MCSYSALAVSLTGCNDQDESSSARGGGDDDDSPYQADQAGIGRSFDADCPNVTLRLEDGRISHCGFNPYDLNGDGPFITDCPQDYFDFCNLAGDYAQPCKAEDIADLLQRIATGEVDPSDPLDTNELQHELCTRLNIEFLLDNFDSRPLTVTTTRVERYADYELRSLLFEDEFVGEFNGFLLLPNDACNVPAVVVSPGHAGSSKAWIDVYFGNYLPQNGYALLALSMRCMAAPNVPAEYDVTRALTLDGFTFIGLQVYEQLLGLKYLRFLGCRDVAVDGNRLGLIGHSGGSTVGNLLIRAAPEAVKVYISDFKSEYINSGESWNLGKVPHDFAPGAWQLHYLINNFDTATMPVLELPYGYAEDGQSIPDGTRRIIEFLDQELKKR
ncbi:MAG: hypothetical protein P9M14_16185 [Candidatus Alcyoniella australis]|nr:hypothetical protein [Candidatus Alcyoniella australis]